MVSIRKTVVLQMKIMVNLIKEASYSHTYLEYCLRL
jgi:hypothetical protein